jgi:hypothetical protein
MFDPEEWYDGDWNDNVMDGHGIYRYRGGHVFKGEFIKGQ